MKKNIIILLLALLVSIPSFALAGDLFSGEFVLESNYKDSMNEEHPSVTAKLNLLIDENEWVDGFHVDLDFISSNLNENDIDIVLNEMYFDYYGENYDLRFGKQLVSWGTALEFNPTDVLNPVNKADFMGDKKSIFMGKVNYYLDDYELTGVVIPYHVPAISEIKMPDPSNPTNTITLTPKVIENSFENTEFAIKFAGKGINGLDYSLSYFRGFEDIPYVNENSLPPAAIFREYSVYGADFATSYNDIGLWAEGAYIVPDNDEAYKNMVIGADYKFSNDIYTEGQIIYQEDMQLNENILIQSAIEKPFAEIHNFRLGSIYNIDTKGYLIKPELEFSLSDATSLILNYTYSDGTLLDGMMGNMFNNDNAFNMSLTYSF